MNSSRSCFVYILSSRSRNLYTGVTNSLERRIVEHRQGLTQGFTKRYRTHRLVYCESFGDIRSAIAREKQIKGWSRDKKIALIEAQNATWIDLAESLFPVEKVQIPRAKSGPRDDSSIYSGRHIARRCAAIPSNPRGHRQ